MANQIVLKMGMVRRWFKILTGSSATAVKQGKGSCYSLDKIQTEAC